MTLHSIAPVFNHQSTVLILGSFPSVRSREVGFFYGHPQNRFWRVISSVFEEQEPKTIEQKTAFLLRNRIALWDVAPSCEIQGSSDSSMHNVAANDLSIILAVSPIQTIFVNGKTAEKYYQKLIEPKINRPAILLPSTSPANATWSTERLIQAWQIIRKQT